MTKVHMVSSGGETDFTNRINEFIKDKIVIDIKFQTMPKYFDMFRALIIYKENEDVKP